MPTRETLQGKAADIVRRKLQLESAFPKFGEAELKSLFQGSGFFAYRADEYVIQQDEESKDVYVVCEGKIAITRTLGSAGATLAVLEAGDVFGEMALVQGGARVASAVAQGPCRVFRLAHPDAVSLMATQPAVKSLFEGLTRTRK